MALGSAQVLGRSLKWLLRSHLVNSVFVKVPGFVGAYSHLTLDDAA